MSVRYAAGKILGSLATLAFVVFFNFFLFRVTSTTDLGTVGPVHATVNTAGALANVAVVDAWTHGFTLAFDKDATADRVAVEASQDGNTWVDYCTTRASTVRVHEGAYAFRDRKSTRLNSSHMSESRMPSSA